MSSSVFLMHRHCPRGYNGRLFRRSRVGSEEIPSQPCHWCVPQCVVGVASSWWAHLSKPVLEMKGNGLFPGFTCGSGLSSHTLCAWGEGLRPRCSGYSPPSSTEHPKPARGSPSCLDPCWCGHNLRLFPLFHPSDPIHGPSTAPSSWFSKVVFSAKSVVLDGRDVVTMFSPLS